ncbi:hypothetical protein ADIMK_3026 [Marinobacterium lacunae]|uniref:Alpha/beta hydrolase n=1 Tax=Marinobacterium lacunae TaxID=1232683 RepID=A0A081FWC2_9GAMM|nr:hypothetical protein ADIMK_3026 [Marinobacterium lacunae]
MAVHGISRNDRSQFAAFRALADRLGVSLFVPRFDGERFPAYQRLAAKPEQVRADRALSMLLYRWQTLRRLPSLKAHMFGYSGGAQFAHRYALLYPDRVATLSVCSAGWYTLPQDDIRYPYGLKGWPQWLGSPDSEAFLKLPILGLVGEGDSQRDAALRKSEKLDRIQGKTRVDRARHWVDQINRRRSVLGISSHALLQVMPGLSHDFEASADSGLMLPLIEQFIQSNGR